MARKVKVPVEMTANTAKFRRGVDSAKSSIRGMGGAVGALQGKIIAAFGIGAITAFVGKVVNWASAITDAAKATGVSVENIQVLHRQSKIAGASVEQMNNALTKLRDAQGEAVKGNKPILDAFRRLGISIDEVTQMSPDQLFQRLGEAVGESGGALTNFSDLVEILGQRNAPKLMEVLETLSGKSLPELREEMKKNGDIISDSTAMALDQAADEWATFFDKVAAGFANFAADLDQFGVFQNFRNPKDLARMKQIRGELAEDAKRLEDLKRKAQANIERNAAAEKKAADDKEESTKRMIKEQREAGEQALESEKAKQKLVEDHLEKVRKLKEAADKKEDDRLKRIGDWQDEITASFKGRMQDVKDSVQESQFAFSSLRSIGANIQGAGRVVSKEDKRIKLAEARNKLLTEMKTAIENIPEDGVRFK